MVADIQLPAFSLLTFDLYDTLIDGENAIYENIVESLRDFPDHAAWMHPSQRGYLMERFAFQEGVVMADHPEMSSLLVLEQSHYRLLAQTLKIDDITLQHSRHFASKFHGWPVLEDTSSAMHTLQGLGFKLVALSNWDPDTVERVMAGPLVGLGIHKMYTAQGIGSYRLDSKSLRRLLDLVVEDHSIDRREVLHIAHGAKANPHFSEALNVATVSIARDAKGRDSTRSPEEIPKEEVAAYSSIPGHYFNSLGEFANACERSFVIDGGG